ncbi:DNA cytosine methyltransferase [Oligella urethralis]|uniref:DNA cytosine methyltransferase n=1 Tax=Oligella urethralis TaxID=90245 RepID=UPI00065F806F|nr:DNA cytosine methyltransferase [Oligella urethralis]
MNFLSICSGIEAASVAFNPLGWQAICFSEIEKFPSEVLAHHYPDVPNMGDMTTFLEWPEEYFRDADMIVGGMPCQAFSIAGAREGLNDERGNLTLTFTEIINHADRIRRKHNRPPVIVLYENVPGIFSDKTNAFGCLLGALAGEDEALIPSGKRWTNAGAVFGPQRAIAWRLLDAQYFGLAQRRKRVFLIASAREDFSPSEILFEFDCVRRDTQPSRKKGQEATGNVGTGFTSSSFGGYSEGVGTLRAAGGDLGGGSETLVKHPHGYRMAAFGEYEEDDSASTLLARDHKDAKDLVVAFNARQDPVSGDVFGALDTCSPQAQSVVIAGTQNDYFRDATENLAPTLRSGNGGGEVNQAIAVQGSMVGRKPENGPQGSGYDDTGVCFTQTSADRHAVAVATQTVYLPLNSMTIQGRPSDDLNPRMGSGIGDPYDPQNTLTSNHHHAVAVLNPPAYQVRRLTPVECERLMGFPDKYTQIPWRNKPAEECPDGHRYKALGNSWAVPVARWIGKRIDDAVKSQAC